MALFIVRHQHAAERCPAADPQMGAMLLNHLSRSNVRQHGVEIQGEAVVQGEHTLYLIAKAHDEVGLREFMRPVVRQFVVSDMKRISFCLAQALRFGTAD